MSDSYLLPGLTQLGFLNKFLAFPEGYGEDFYFCNRIFGSPRNIITVKNSGISSVKINQDSGNRNNSSMEIRRTRKEEIKILMGLYDEARTFMRRMGNAEQWLNGYPSAEVVWKDIMQGNSYVCIEEGEIIGTFCFMQGVDPNYRIIENGHWLNDAPYGVIHRLASSGRKKRLADVCIRWCSERCPNLRVDTHRDNWPMQEVLKRNGFRECGIIYVEDGTPRIAYQREQPF